MPFNYMGLERITDYPVLDIDNNLYVNDKTSKIEIPPTEIKCGRYFLPSHPFSKNKGYRGCNFEDIAARLIQPAKEQNRWVGIDFDRLANDIKIDAHRMLSSNLKNWFYNRFRMKYPEPFYSPLAKLIKKSHISGSIGLETIILGTVAEMIVDDYLTNDENIVFPTEKLIREIYTAQQKQVSDTANLEKHFFPD